MYRNDSTAALLPPTTKDTVLENFPGSLRIVQCVQKNPRKGEDRGTEEILVEHILHVLTVHEDAFSFVERDSFLVVICP